MVRNARIWLATAALFTTGFVTGSLVTRTLAIRESSKRSAEAACPLPMGQERRWDYLRQMSADLSLTPPQHSQADKILGKSQERLKALWEPVAPKVKEEYKRCRKELSAILTPGQRLAFEANRKKSPTERLGPQAPLDAENEPCRDSDVIMPGGRKL